MNAIDYFRANPAALVSALHPLNLQDAVMLALDAIDHPIAKGLGVSCDARDFRAAVDAAVLEWAANPLPVPSRSIFNRSLQDEQQANPLT